ncbi:MAG TPA: hypothetical protein VFB62_12525 [Polyangiaceae bacterium]|nr:hypothetical protein [Polyangiaceae bacterium]
MRDSTWLARSPCMAAVEAGDCLCVALGETLLVLTADAAAVVRRLLDEPMPLAQLAERGGWEPHDIARLVEALVDEGFVITLNERKGTFSR